MSLSNFYESHGRAVVAIRSFAPRAACRGASITLFYPGRDGEVGGWNKEDAVNAAKAKAICNGCDVQSECLAYAMEYDEPFGVWGGLTSRERNKLRRTWSRLNR